MQAVAGDKEQLVQVEGGYCQICSSHSCQADGLLQDVIKRYRQGTPEQFWEKFSQNGKRMSFTAIDSHLCLIRKEEKDRATEEARVKLGASFDSVCSYRMGGEVHVLCRPSVILKRLELLGAEHADVPVE